LVARRPCSSAAGISGAIDLDAVPERRRPDAAIDGVADLLQRL
jgi:hypothetical protein